MKPAAFPISSARSLAGFLSATNGCHDQNYMLQQMPCQLTFLPNESRSLTMPTVEVTTTYLEMLDPADLRPRRSDSPDWQIVRAPLDVAVNRQFYYDVGRDWHWIDRLAWDDARWQAYIDQPGLETWIALLGERAIGYFELDMQPGQGIEIAYLGLLPEFIGWRLGGAPLDRRHRAHLADGNASRLGAHLHARSSASARQLSRPRPRVYKTETHLQEICS